VEISNWEPYGVKILFDISYRSNIVRLREIGLGCFRVRPIHTNVLAILWRGTMKRFLVLAVVVGSVITPGMSFG